MHIISIIFDFIYVLAMENCLHRVYVEIYRLGIIRYRHIRLYQ